MYFVSAVIRLVQELKSKRTADYLASLVETDVTVWCDNESGGQWGQTSSLNLKTGDKIFLEAGMKIPHNVKLSTASDFYISESAITGESDIFEKAVDEVCRAGSIVVGGKAEGIVEIATDYPRGKKIFNKKDEKRKPSFDKGAAAIAVVLLRFAVILIPLVFIISFTTNPDAPEYILTVWGIGYKFVE